MFYFVHKPDLIFSPHLPVFIDPENGNVGVHRTFAPDENGVLRCTGTQYLITEPKTSLDEKKVDLLHSKLFYVPIETCEQKERPAENKWHINNYSALERSAMSTGMPSLSVQ
jgi:hypothetical protein